MGKADAQSFLGQLEHDAPLRQAVESMGSDSFAERVVKLGAERGLNFSVEELMSAAQKPPGASAELADEELESVAGGTDNPNWVIGGPDGNVNSMLYDAVVNSLTHFGRSVKRTIS
jgi:predicted ribosomally synthesized peptide with nif11-like leader